jgi:hypothetical protein
MRKGKRVGVFLVVGILVIALGSLGWFLSLVFEGESPALTLGPMSEYLSGNESFTVTVTDKIRGLKNLKIYLDQEGREIPILEKSFPFKGLLNGEGVHRFVQTFSLNPVALNLAQGRVDLTVRAWDYSRRRGGDGNLAMIQHKMVVDTIPPAVRALSRMHNINVGGAGLVVYQASSDTIESGVFVDKLFFQGFPAQEKSQDGVHVCYFAIPYDANDRAELFLWAKDKAGNESRSTFYHHVRDKRFREERINVTSGFLNRVLPYFSFYSFEAGSSDIEKFVKINRTMRKENAQTFYDLRTKTAPRRLWDGTWERLKNAANMARFGDRRDYYYEGKPVDEQVHMGVDLASLVNSQVPAANDGYVIFAGRLGIYGLTVVLDHGQGLASSYSHLSKINVKLGQEITKGETLGLTGETGLAGGDHLHFAVMVNGIFVNPIEWWDSHWIQDNVTRQLAVLK